MAPDPWFSTYDSTCQIAQEIAEKIQQRNQYERNGENTTKLTVTIRALLQKLKEKIALLKDLLLRAVSTHQITQLEGDRRQNLLDDLVTRERLLLASFKNEGAEPELIRASEITDLKMGYAFCLFFIVWTSDQLAACCPNGNQWHVQSSSGTVAGSDLSSGGVLAEACWSPE
ncbi:hypothetical protein CB1_000300024 [Camelus ferus]|nr:hypothetical protein CB1_000300024 [Camelus ferus]